MKRAALIALAATPVVAASIGVVAAGVISSRDVEETFSAGGERSSCVEAANDHADLWGAPIFTEQGEGWSVAIYADIAECAEGAAVAECALRAPARVTYAAGEGERIYNIETIGEHRVRANRNGLSCRRMN